MYTNEMAIVITPMTSFYISYNHSQKETVSNLPSRLEVGFLLDSGASFAISSERTHMKITQIFKKIITINTIHQKLGLMEPNRKL